MIHSCLNYEPWSFGPSILRLRSHQYELLYTKPIAVMGAVVVVRGYSTQPTLLFQTLPGREWTVEQYGVLQHPGQQRLFMVWHQGGVEPV